MNVLITGGSGFIGQHMIKSLLDKQHNITVLARKPLALGPSVKVIHALSSLPSNSHFDCLINLAGSPIDCLWTEKAKQRLYNSRVQTTAALIELIQRLDEPPTLLISASAVGYYGHDATTTFTETTPPHDGFTHELCQAWEQSANQAETLGVRVCLARLGVVLGANGGFIKKVTLPFQLGLGGTLGSGQQYFPWIHIDDVIRAFWHFIDNPNCHGAYNLVAPEIITNQVLTSHLGKALQHPTWLSLPSPLIRCLFGEMGETLLLSGSQVSAEKLMNSGFHFEHSNIESALGQVFT